MFRGCFLGSCIICLLHSGPRLHDDQIMTAMKNDTHVKQSGGFLWGVVDCRLIPPETVGIPVKAAWTYSHVALLVVDIGCWSSRGYRLDIATVNK